MPQETKKPKGATTGSNYAKTGKSTRKSVAPLHKGEATGSFDDAANPGVTMADSLLNPSSQKGYLEDSMDKFAEEMHPAIAQANAVQETKNVMDEAMKIAGGDNKLGSPKLTNMTDAIHAANQAVMQDWIKVLDSPEMKKSRVMGDLGGIIGAVGGAFGMPGLMIGGNKLAGMAKTTQDQFLLPLAKQMDTAVQGAMSAYQPDSMMARTGGSIVENQIKSWEDRVRTLGIKPTKTQRDTLKAIPSVQAAGLDEYIDTSFDTISSLPQDQRTAAIDRQLTTGNVDAMMKVDTAVETLQENIGVMNDISESTEDQDYKGARRKAWEYIKATEPSMIEAPIEHIESKIDELVKYTKEGEPIITESPTSKVSDLSISMFTGVTAGTAYIGSMLGMTDPKQLSETGQISRNEIKEVPLLVKMNNKVASRAVLINEFMHVLKKESIKKQFESGTVVKIPTRFDIAGSGGGGMLGLNRGGAKILDRDTGLITVFADPLGKNATPDQIDAAWDDAWVNTNKFSAEFRAYLRGVAPKLRT